MNLILAPLLLGALGAADPAFTLDTGTARILVQAAREPGSNRGHLLELAGSQLRVRFGEPTLPAITVSHAGGLEPLACCAWIGRRSRPGRSAQWFALPSKAPITVSLPSLRRPLDLVWLSVTAFDRHAEQACLVAVTGAPADDRDHEAIDSV